MEKLDAESRITKTVVCGYAKILIDGGAHLVFALPDVIALHAFISLGVYTFELTFRHGATVKVEYDDRAKWERVIALIEEELAL